MRVYLDSRDFYYKEWHQALKDDNEKYAKACKNIYTKIVTEWLTRPYNQRIEKLKAYPMIYLN